MFFWKIMIVVFAAVIIWQLVRVSRLGRSMAHSGDVSNVEAHRSAVHCVGWLSLIAIVLIETLVRTSPAPYAASGALFPLHLAVDACLATAFVVLLLFTGLKNPRVHRPLAYGFFGLYAAAFLSGTLLLYRLPST